MCLTASKIEILRCKNQCNYLTQWTSSIDSSTHVRHKLVRWRSHWRLRTPSTAFKRVRKR